MKETINSWEEKAKTLRSLRVINAVSYDMLEEKWVPLEVAQKLEKQVEAANQILNEFERAEELNLKNGYLAKSNFGDEVVIRAKGRLDLIKRLREALTQK